jgi:LPS export ABC transporter protein LptC
MCRRYGVFRRALTAALFMFGCVSCAIQYNTIEDNSDNVPEFMLRDAVVSRYENSQLKVRADAGLIEQYKQQNIFFAQNVACEVYADDGTLQTTGAFGFVVADTDSEVYTLFDNISVENHAENTSVRAEQLKWSGKTGLLASGNDSPVTIIRAGETAFEFSGVGFSADTFNRTYQFSGVSGTIIADAEGED